MGLSVVVVTYNSAQCIRECLGAVKAELPRAEIIVVDNGSGDATRRLAETEGVRLIANERNVGFGRACNAGAEAARASHLLFLNPDVLVTRAEVAALEELLDSKPFGLAAPEPTEPSAGLMGAQSERHWLADWYDQTLATLRPRELRRRPTRHRRRAETWLSGSILFASRVEFLELGGFDPRFFLYYEDRDLSARYRDAGLPLRTTRALSGAHAGTASSDVDDIHIEPLGWAFLGWIEYLWIHRGEATARRAARTGVTTLRSLRIAARLAPGSRAERKNRQLHEVLAFLEKQANDRAAHGFCPEARRVLAAVG
jgi:GT2 family glycosyltransferase